MTGVCQRQIQHCRRVGETRTHWRNRMQPEAGRPFVDLSRAEDDMMRALLDVWPDLGPTPVFQPVEDEPLPPPSEPDAAEQTQLAMSDADFMASLPLPVPLAPPPPAVHEPRPPKTPEPRNRLLDDVRSGRRLRKVEHVLVPVVRRPPSVGDSMSAAMDARRARLGEVADEGSIDTGDLDDW